MILFHNVSLLARGFLSISMFWAFSKKTELFLRDFCSVNKHATKRSIFHISCKQFIFTYFLIKNGKRRIYRILIRSIISKKSWTNSQNRIYFYANTRKSNNSAVYSGNMLNNFCSTATATPSDITSHDHNWFRLITK